MKKRHWTRMPDVVGDHEVYVNDSAFFCAHGKHPRGLGKWAFALTGGQIVWTLDEMLFTEAKKQAIEEERRRNPGLSVSIIAVLS